MFLKPKWGSEGSAVYKSYLNSESTGLGVQQCDGGSSLPSQTAVSGR